MVFEGMCVLNCVKLMCIYYKWLLFNKICLQNEKFNNFNDNVVHQKLIV